MLSVENPPRDPPCPCEISQLKSSSDEKASANLEAVDLLNAGLDDNNYHLPKFSIRDYVFSTRSKDIKNNWPFSQENLQLCLKHGMTEVLPPFQPLDALRNPSQEKCNVSSILLDEEKLSSSDGQPYGPSDEYVFVNSNSECDRKLVVDSSNINLSGSEGDKDFPSTTTSQSCSDIDTVPTNKSPSLDLEANTLLEPLIAKSEAVIPPKSSKAESSNQPAAKKCKLIVKLNNLAHTSTKEDTAMNNYMVSEAMASKVCPVCKTFSSSSNTTLNAHIDQCLSGESTTKWAGDSRVIKHRIKPKKMRSMVDIYATASHCTLEELDRRNGTNWALNSSMPLLESEICAHQNKPGGFSPVDSDETPNESAVYIDANGTKLRILSKFNDPSSDSKTSDEPRPKKLIKGDKGGKFLLAKKKRKKNMVQKQHQLSKNASQGKKICTSDPIHTSQIDEGQDRNFSCEKNYTREDCMPQQVKALDGVKFSKPEIIRGWVCSKRSGLTKKFNGRDDQLHSGGYTNREMQPENNQSSPCTNVKRSSVVRIRNENSPSSSPTNGKTIDNSSHELHSEYGEHPSPKKRLGLSVMESQYRDRKRSVMLQEFPESSAKHLRDDSSRKVEIRAGTVRNDQSNINPKSSSSQQALMSKSKKFSFLKKHVLSTDRASASDSKSFSKRKCSVVRKSRMQSLSQTNQKAAVSRSGVDRHFMQNSSKNQATVEGNFPEESRERTRDIKIKSVDEHTVSREEVVSTPIIQHHDTGENCGPLMLSGTFTCTSDVGESAGKSERACRRDIDMELPSEDTVGGTFMGFSETLDPRFNGIEEPTGTQCDSQQYIEPYKGPLFESEAATSSAEPILSGEQEMFCADGTAENMMGENVCRMVELDSSNGQGNYFGEVDSIPIPGPPGSFLPSPGRMDSEDLHGISSLSSSKVQSSDDHQELIDHSSESPVSTTSTISNSTLGRSDVKSLEKISGEPPILDGLKSDYTSVATNVADPVVENLTPVCKASDPGVGKLGLDELKANVTIPDKGPFRFKNDQPCCCSRKESIAQNVALNYQDSALLRRRSMASVPIHANRMQMNVDFNRSLENGSSVNERSPVPEEASSRSSMGQVSSRVSIDSESKFSVHGNCDSVSPPTPSPVLRLMGKNLMVVSKDESVSPHIRTSQSSTLDVHANSKGVPIPTVPTGHSQNEGHLIVHQVVSEGPFFFDQTETKGFMQHPDMRCSSGFGSHGISVRPQMSSLESSVIHSSGSTARGFTGSLMHHEYTGGGYHSPTQLLRPRNRPRIPMAYDMEKLAESPSLRWRNSVPAENTIKEIIIIDDTPDNEVNPTAVATHNHHRRGGGESSVSILASRSSARDSWGASPFYITTPYESATYTGSVVDANFQLPPAKGANTSAVRWNCNPEVLGVVRPSSLTAASSSSPHLRSELYNPSGF